MAVITGYTAARMKQIEDTTVTSGSVNGSGNLILATRVGANIDAGNVRGPQGIQGIKGNTGNTGSDGISGGTTASRDARYGVPTTDPQRVALANNSPLWFNVATGKLEQYYALTGTSGLTVPGLPVGFTPGWYESLRYRQDRHMAFTRASAFAWSGGFTGWDAGTLVKTTDSTISALIDTTNAIDFCVPGSVSGSLKFLEVGTYDMAWYNEAATNPGNAGYRISAIGTWPNSFDQKWIHFGHQIHPAFSNGYWETMIQASAVRIPQVNLEIRFQGNQENNTNNIPRIRISKRSELN